MSHKCPGSACGGKADVPTDMLACRKDWYRLPRGLRNRVWAAWANGEGAGSDEHNAAVTEALDWYASN